MQCSTHRWRNRRLHYMPRSRLDRRYLSMSQSSYDHTDGICHGRAKIRYASIPVAVPIVVSIIMVPMMVSGAIGATDIRPHVDSSGIGHHHSNRA